MSRRRRPPRAWLYRDWQGFGAMIGADEWERDTLVLGVGGGRALVVALPAWLHRCPPVEPWRDRVGLWWCDLCVGTEWGAVEDTGDWTADDACRSVDDDGRRCTRVPDDHGGWHAACRPTDAAYHPLRRW